MNAKKWIHGFILVCLLLIPVQPAPAQPAWQVDEPLPADVPGWKMPEKIIPYHDVARSINPESYTTWASVENAENGIMETVQLNGVDAMVADGYDPLAGNYRLVGLDKLLRSGKPGSVGAHGLETFKLEKVGEAQQINRMEGSLEYFGNYPSSTVVAGDLNNDDQDEQITAWLDGNNRLLLATGEMPGSFGRATSAPAAAPRQPTAQYALQLDGVDDYVNVPNFPTLNQPRISVGLWAKSSTANWNNDGFLVSKRDAYVLHPIVGTKNVRFYVFIGGWKSVQFTAPADIDITQWHYYTGTYDGKCIRIYLDGRLVGETAQTGDINTGDTGPLTIGRDDGSNRYFNGQLDEVRIWSRAITKEEVASEMYLPGTSLDALVAAWRLDETAGMTAIDSSGKGNDGTLTNGPARIATNLLDADLDLLVRGYDHALWHCVYNKTTKNCAWDREGGGGVLLSAPVVVAKSDGQFDVYAILADNLVYRRSWNGSAWAGTWQLVDVPGYWAPLEKMVPVPEVLAPAVVERSGVVHLFRLAPDKTLRWRFYNGSTWSNWSRLGGMLASAPSAVVDSDGQVRVFARGADEAVWTRTYQGNAWQRWTRIPLTGMDEGVTLASPPSALAGPAKAVTLYARGSDDNLWSVEFNGTAWGAWSSLESSLASGVGAVRAGSEIFLFALTGTGALQVNRAGSGWADLPKGLPPCCTLTDTGLTGVKKESFAPYNDFSVDIDTGYFWGDGRRQSVVGYMSSANKASLLLYDLSDSPAARGFTQEMVLSEAFTLAQEVSYIRIATGNFTDEGPGILPGLDEIAVLSVDKAATSMQVDILALKRDPLRFELVSSATVKGSSGLDYAFAGSLDIVAGNFDQKSSLDHLDEVAVVSGWYKNDGKSSNCSVDLRRFNFVMRIFDLVFQGGAHSLNPYWIENVYNSTRVNYDADPGSVTVTLAAGDTDADGQDELVRTWPSSFPSEDVTCWLVLKDSIPQSDRYIRNVKVFKFDTWPAGGGQVTTDEGKLLHTTGGNRYSYGDRLAVGDFNRDLKEEVIWQYGSNDQKLVLYAYGLKTDGSYTKLGTEVTTPWLDNARLAVGDFTAQTIRVGPPTYRRQYDVGKIIAIVNAPPKHADWVDSVHHNLNADQEGTYSMYAQVQGMSTELNVETKKEWGVDVATKTTIGDPEGTHVTNSMNASYGQNFSKTGNHIQSKTFDQTVRAITDDVVYYTRINYDVWEYPIFNSLTNTPEGHLSVVWPVGGMRMAVEDANLCSGWYRPNHQLMNVWSYPSSPNGLLSRDPEGDNDLRSEVPSYMIGSMGADFGISFSELIQSKLTRGYQMGFSREFEAQVGGDQVTVDLKVVEWTTRLPSVSFSMKGSYDQSALSTWTTTTTSETTLRGIFMPLSNPANSQYNVYPYLYWTDNNFLVLDYVTEPSDQSFWSSSGSIYNRPDPAFILPWWADGAGRCDHLWSDSRYYTGDVTISPPVADPGDMVKITAVVRNFSQVGNWAPPYNQAFKVAFYQGEPDSGGQWIGEKTIAAGDLGPRGELHLSIDWIASGSGEQHIYAVIDPEGALVEVHDENDAKVNNNKGYGVLHLNGIEFIDVGSREKVYQPVNLNQGAGSAVSDLLIPQGAFSENLRVDMISLAGGHITSLGLPFEVNVYQKNWQTPVRNFNLRPMQGESPAVLMVSYAGIDLQGNDEELLKLYRFNGSTWEEAQATCGSNPDYEVVRFTDDDLLAVPLCTSGLFALGVIAPEVVLAPQAGFTASPLEGDAPLTVQFTDQSLNSPESWTWNFGDGTPTSAEQNPLYTYTQPGEYTVTLVVKKGIFSDVLTRTEYITVNEPPQLQKKLYLPVVVR